MGVSKKCPTTLSDKEQAIGFHGNAILSLYFVSNKLKHCTFNNNVYFLSCKFVKKIILPSHDTKIRVKFRNMSPNFQR